MKAPSRILFRALLAGACLLAALPASAQTVLLIVREKKDAQPLPPPLAVREGVSGSLFDAGFIVIDAPGTAAVPGPTELAKLARSAGAELVLQCSTEYADTSLGADMVRISARTSFALIDSSNGGILFQGTGDATNKDRERDVGRTALGAEIGKDIAGQVKKAIESRSGPA
jgi:hypothetical protein